MAKKKNPYDMDFHSIADMINHRLDECGVTKYALAHNPEIEVAPATVFRFLGGECKAQSDTIEQLLRVAGLKIVPEATKPEWATKK